MVSLKVENKDMDIYITNKYIWINIYIIYNKWNMDKYITNKCQQRENRTVALLIECKTEFKELMTKEGF